MYHNDLSKSRWSFGLTLEKAILTNLSEHRQASPACLVPIFEQLITFQSHFCLLLEPICQASGKPKFSGIDQTIVPDDMKWQLHTEQFAICIEDSANVFIPLWSAATAFEKSGMFYRQCALATADPAEKIFSLSLAEMKKVMAHRTEGVSRICVNHTWEKIGFSPFPVV